MLVCSISQLRRGATIPANVVEAASAADASASGSVIFAALVDDPASVSERVDAYLGNIMVEAASAQDAVNAGLAYAAAIVEAATAADLLTGAVPTVVSASVLEAAAAASIQDATIAAAVASFEGAIATGPLMPFAALPPIVIYLDETDPR